MAVFRSKVACSEAAQSDRPSGRTVLTGVRWAGVVPISPTVQQRERCLCLEEGTRERRQEVSGAP
ncbi:hypothetical protein E2C01_066110 [Portunus trituberculatus]|uniref:Uncharacterized protein n=1 Tax=Portunus trituberculatus TaxID=210409 RepID=A0A5B7HHD3_PORTR|nr:hypothetical protein [Portunus trituberculatus]